MYQYNDLHDFGLWEHLKRGQQQHLKAFVTAPGNEDTDPVMAAKGLDYGKAIIYLGLIALKLGSATGRKELRQNQGSYVLKHTLATEISKQLQYAPYPYGANSLNRYRDEEAGINTNPVVDKDGWVHRPDRKADYNILSTFDTYLTNGQMRALLLVSGLEPASVIDTHSKFRIP